MWWIIISTKKNSWKKKVYYNSKNKKDLDQLKKNVLTYETSHASAFKTKDYANANKVLKHLVEPKKELKQRQLKKPEKSFIETKDLAKSKARAQYWLRVTLLISGFLFVHLLVQFFKASRLKNFWYRNHCLLLWLPKPKALSFSSIEMDMLFIHTNSIKDLASKLDKFVFSISRHPSYLDIKSNI